MIQPYLLIKGLLISSLDPHLGMVLVELDNAVTAHHEIISKVVPHGLPSACELRIYICNSWPKRVAASVCLLRNRRASY